jgi:hypothetical protein
MTNPGVPPEGQPTTAEFDALYLPLIAEVDGMTFGSITPNLMAVAQARQLRAPAQQIIVATSDLRGEFMTGYRAELAVRHNEARVRVGMARDIRDRGHPAVVEEPTDLLRVFARASFNVAQGRRARPVFDRMAELVRQLLEQ